MSNEKLKDSYIKQINLSSKFEVIFSSIKQLAYIGTIAVSAILVIKGYMLIGYLVACSNYVLKIMDHISQINNNLFQMQQQFVSGQKMMYFMNCKSKIIDRKESIEINDVPNISIRNAYLTMEDNQVLKDVSVEIPYGKKVGIVGGTGSGKSVLLESLMRIHDLTLELLR